MDVDAVDQLRQDLHDLVIKRQKDLLPSQFAAVLISYAVGIIKATGGNMDVLKFIVDGAVNATLADINEQ